MLPSWRSKIAVQAALGCWWRSMIGALLMPGPARVTQLRTEQEALIISDRWAGNNSFYPRAWSSDRLHLCLISASPAININHDQWWGEHIQIRHNPRAHIQSDHHHHQVWAMMWGLSSYPGIVITCWLLILNTRSPSRQQPVFTALPCATHNGSQNLHKIALQNLCIKLTDV